MPVDSKSGVSLGEAYKAHAWRVRNLITTFCQVAKRPHRPRERNIRRLYKMVGIAVPEGQALYAV